MNNNSALAALEPELNKLHIAATDRELGSGGAKLQVLGPPDSPKIEVTLGFPGKSTAAALREQIAEVLAGAGVTDVPVSVETSIESHSVAHGLKPLPGVRNIIAVASGKGGVGKSTVAANLAVACASEGATVGLLDADIYGPSQPTMLGLEGARPSSPDGKTMEPIAAHGIQTMSIGYLVDDRQPMAWRGPMVTSALTQLLNQTNWNDLDYLFVDMPPGTGDIQLTLAQRVPVSGAVIVTTPQSVALADARKALEMFRKVNVPVLGVIENMSTHVCSSCGHEEAIFGAGGADKMAKDFDVDILGALPLDAKIREQADSGRPTVASDPDAPAADAYRSAARRMAAALAMQGRDYAAKFPKIVVEDS